MLSPRHPDASLMPTGQVGGGRRTRVESGLPHLATLLSRLSSSSCLLSECRAGWSQGLVQPPAGALPCRSQARGTAPTTRPNCSQEPALHPPPAPRLA